MSQGQHHSDRPAAKKRPSIEELKARRDPLDVWREIEGWATTGYETIPEEKFDLLKWYGLYRQHPRAGHFMMRIRVPGGRLNLEQARAVASISRQFARGTLDITVRQDFQLHYMTIEAVPESVRRLHAVGLTTTMACGDVPRNITCCPLSGRLRDEIADTYPLVKQLTRAVLANRAYSNLPRKFKASISGCPVHCPLPEVNDIGLCAAVRQANRGKQAGLNVMVGGGLAAVPMLARSVDAFVPIDKAVEVCLVIIEIFRDIGYRQNRVRARMKFLVKDMGPDAFRAEIVRRLGYDLDRAVEVNMNAEVFRDHLGIVEQKQAGLYTLGFCTSAGRITPEDLFVAADIAQVCGSGTLLNSCMQNLLVPDIPQGKLGQAQEMALNAPTLTLHPHPIRAGMVVCTGSEFCTMAMAETKNRSSELLNFLEKEVQVDVPIKISVSGCSHSCSQYQLADIGLRGRKIRMGDELVDGFDIFVGCQMGDNPEVGRCVKGCVVAEEIGPEIARMLKTYLRDRRDSETFREHVRRTLAAAYEI